MAHYAAAYHVLPHKHAKAVAVIVPPQRLNFYVLSQHIKAKALHSANILNHSLVRGRGIKSVGPVPLVEHAAVKKRLSVEHKTHNPVLILPNGKFAHGKIACNLVLAQGDFHVVKKRVVWAPRMERVKDVGFEHGFSAFVRPIFGNNPAVLINYDIRHFGVFCRNFKQNLAVLKKRGDFQIFYVVFRRFLKPNRLPYSALGGVPDSAALQCLFSVCVVRAV